MDFKIFSDELLSFCFSQFFLLNFFKKPLFSYCSIGLGENPYYRFIGFTFFISHYVLLQLYHLEKNQIDFSDFL